MSDHRVRKTVAAYFAAASMLDAPALSALFSAQGESHDPVGSPARRGKQEIETAFAALAGQLVEFSQEATRAFVCGDRAAVHWNAQGSAKNGRQVMFTGIAVFDLTASGEIQRLDNFWDPVPVQAELSRPPREEKR